MVTANRPKLCFPLQALFEYHTLLWNAPLVLSLPFFFFVQSKIITCRLWEGKQKLQTEGLYFYLLVVQIHRRNRKNTQFRCVMVLNKLVWGGRVPFEGSCVGTQAVIMNDGGSEYKARDECAEQDRHLTKSTCSPIRPASCSCVIYSCDFSCF